MNPAGGQPDESIVVISPDNLMADIPVKILYLFPELHQPYREFLRTVMTIGLEHAVFPDEPKAIVSVDQNILARAIIFAEFHDEGPLSLEVKEELLGDYESVEKMVKFYSSLEADCLIIQLLIYLCQKQQPQEDISALIQNLSL